MYEKRMCSCKAKMHVHAVRADTVHVCVVHASHYGHSSRLMFHVCMFALAMHVDVNVQTGFVMSDFRNMSSCIVTTHVCS